MTKKLISLAVLTLLLVSGISTSFAQGTLTIEYGDTLQGRIVNPEKGVLYAFEGSAGDEIILQAVSDSMDVYMRLGDSDGNIVAENDDISKNNTNSEIVYTLEENAVYYFAVLGYSAGDYEVSLDATNAGGEQEIVTLQYGDTASGETIDMDNAVIFAFEGQRGDEVLVVAASSEVDTYLVMIDEAAEVIGENDNYDRSTTDAAISVVLPANGWYYIGVFAEDAGYFEIGLFEGEQDVSNSGSTNGGFTNVSNDEPVGELWTGTVDDDTPFNQIVLEDVPEGATITVDIRATSGDLDAYAGVIFNDEVIYDNDDRAKGDSNPYIELRAEEAGTYVIIITRYGFEDGTSSGDFEATVTVSGAARTGLISEVAYDSDGSRSVIKPDFGVRAFNIDGEAVKTEDPLLAGVSAPAALPQ